MAMSTSRSASGRVGPNRSARVEARISPDALETLKRAAAIQGRTLSDFLVAAAQEVAERTIAEATVIRLDAEEQRRFVELLLVPPEPAGALERAREAHEALFAAR